MTLTRFVNSAAETAADQPHVDYAFLVQLDFASGAKRVFNGIGTLTFNGQTYLGLGEYGSIDSIGESTDLRPANPLTLQLSGVDATTVATAMDRTEYFGRSARIDVAFFDSAMQVLTPIEDAAWEGDMDQVSINRDQPSKTVTLTCENRLAIFDETIGLLNTTEYQAAIDPTDLIFDQVPFVRNKVVSWGSGLVDRGGRERFWALPPRNRTPGVGGGLKP